MSESGAKANSTAPMQKDSERRKLARSAGQSGV